MRIRRGLLFWGLFLIPLGVIPLLAREGYIDLSGVGEIWRFWPLLLIALGLGLLLGRRSIGLVVVAATALLLGAMGGAVIAGADLGVGTVTSCVGVGGDEQQVEQQGTFSEPGSIELDLDCGSLQLTTAPGQAWSVVARYRGEPPRIDGDGSELTIDSPDGLTSDRQDWTVVAPADGLRTIELDSNAASSTLTLAGATVDALDVDLNAGDVLIDGTGAEIARLDVGLNAGRARVTLDSSTTGQLSANAGALELCVPPDADLRITAPEQFTFATNLDSQGLRQSDDTWTRTGSGARIDLRVEGNAASFTLDPEEGCR